MTSWNGDVDVSASNKARKNTHTTFCECKVYVKDMPYSVLSAHCSTISILTEIYWIFSWMSPREHWTIVLHSCRKVSYCIQVTVGLSFCQQMVLLSKTYSASEFESIILCIQYSIPAPPQQDKCSFGKVLPKFRQNFSLNCFILFFGAMCSKTRDFTVSFKFMHNLTNMKVNCMNPIERCISHVSIFTLNCYSNGGCK